MGCSGIKVHGTILCQASPSWNNITRHRKSERRFQEIGQTLETKNNRLTRGLVETLTGGDICLLLVFLVRPYSTLMTIVCSGVWLEHQRDLVEQQSHILQSPRPT
jgi:hypothetical protein